MSAVAEDLNKKHVEEIKIAIANYVKDGVPVNFQDASKFNDIENDLIMSAQRAGEVAIRAKVELGLNINKVYIHESFRERQNDFIFVLPVEDKDSERFNKVFSLVREIKKKSHNLKCLFLADYNLNNDLLEADGYEEAFDIISIP